MQSSFELVFKIDQNIIPLQEAHITTQLTHVTIQINTEAIQLLGLHCKKNDFNNEL